MATVWWNFIQKWWLLIWHSATRNRSWHTEEDSLWTNLFGGLEGFGPLLSGCVLQLAALYIWISPGFNPNSFLIPCGVLLSRGTKRRAAHVVIMVSCLPNPARCIWPWKIYAFSMDWILEKKLPGYVLRTGNSPTASVGCSWRRGCFHVFSL